MTNPIKILRLPEVKARTGLGGSSIYRKIAAKQFPNSVPLGLRAVGWVEEEVSAWLSKQMACRC